MTADTSITQTVVDSFNNSREQTNPGRHFLFDTCLPPDVVDQVLDMPIKPADITSTEGKRSTNNDSRVHFGIDNRGQYPVMDKIAEAYQSPEVVEAIERNTGADLADSLLRIELCQDSDGFWLEPHIDIGVKRLSMMIYLNRDDDTLGTDLYTADHQLHPAAPAPLNSGLLFIAQDQVVHGFEKREIKGVRKALMVNYVGPEWRNTHELCYPDKPVR